MNDEQELTPEEKLIVLNSLECLKYLSFIPEITQEMKKNNILLDALVEEVFKIKEVLRG